MAEGKRAAGRTEHRKAARSRVNLSAQVRGPKAYFSHARCMTISPHGAEILLDWPIESGQVYALTVSLTPQLTLAEARATCVRCSKVGALFRAALSFTNLHGATFQALRAMYQRDERG